MESITIFRNNATELISENIKGTVQNIEEYVLLCIGTGGVVSDSLGPRVGSLVKNNLKKPLIIYGDDDNNINAQNLPLAVDFIHIMHPDKKIAVIDAAVGDSTEVGCVQVISGGITPGAATDKTLPKLGDVSVLGVVSLRGAQNFYSSHEDRVTLVQKMAQTIADAIINVA